VITISGVAMYLGEVRGHLSYPHTDTVEFHSFFMPLLLVDERDGQRTDWDGADLRSRPTHRPANALREL